jgi:formylglycine-generating enzyme required for sulfatase activity
MVRSCPSCHRPAEAGDAFCTECGQPLGRDEPRAPEATGAELVVEVEVNRPMVHGHALLLRFRVTSTMRFDCTVTMRMKLSGQGLYIEQAAEGIERRCRLTGRGEQSLLSFPFHSLRPGHVYVEELRVIVCPHGSSRPLVQYELPDQSLLIPIVDPSLEARSPGIVISGGINIDISKLEDLYGVDIKNILTLNASQQTGGGHPEITWQPIKLRVVPDAPPPDALRLTLPGGILLELVRIRAGAFVMGSPEEYGKDDESPAHFVRITRDFFMGKFPVTQEQFAALMGQNPSRFPVSARHPVDNVSWDDAQEFCRRLQAHLTQWPVAPDEIRFGAVGLPTEAEWEYACRASTQTLFSFGDDPGQLSEYGWFDKNSGRTTHPVGQRKPNARGLYDMHGNVWEWCGDSYAEDYSCASEVDPRGPAGGDRRVLRGGSWSYFARQCRSASRHAAPPASRTANYGFRVVLRSP